MDTPALHLDFKDFLLLLNSKGVEYLLVGGYAVGYYGYVRATADIDLWIERSPRNAALVVAALHEFGFGMSEVRDELFLKPDSVVRLGVPPFRIEVITTASGVDFRQCYGRRVSGEIDGVPVQIISLDDLKANKAASGRGKDLVDLEHLP